MIPFKTATVRWPVRFERMLLVGLIFAVVGCESDDAILLREERGRLHMQIAEREAIARDLEERGRELNALRSKLSQLETDYSPGALVAAMGARPTVSITPGPPVQLDEHVFRRRVELSAPHSLLPELQRLQRSRFPAFWLERVTAVNGAWTAELSWRIPAFTVHKSTPAERALPPGHWWDGSDKVRQGIRQLRTRSEVLGDAIEKSDPDLLHLSAYKATLMRALSSDDQLRRHPRDLPVELELLSDGTWQRPKDAELSR